MKQNPLSFQPERTNKIPPPPPTHHHSCYLSYLTRWGILAAAFLSMGALACSAAERKTASASSRPASKTRDVSKARAGQALAKLKEKGIIQSAQELRSAKGVDVMRRAIIYSKPAVLKLMLIAGRMPQLRMNGVSPCWR